MEKINWGDFMFGFGLGMSFLFFVICMAILIKEYLL